MNNTTQNNPRPEGKGIPCTTSWRPLLTGDEAAVAWAVIEEVAMALADGPADIKRTHAEMDPSLASGAAGRALFYGYLALAVDDDRYADLASACLDQMIETTARCPPRAGLYSGFSGVAWTLRHLEGRLLERDPGGDGAGHEVDDVLLALLRGGTWTGVYDLISGLAGFGVYALEVLPRAAGHECLSLLLDQLEGLAEERPEGLCWHTPPEHLVDYQRKQHPQGYYNLGLAHGVPALIVFLAALCGVEPTARRARGLLEPTVAWLLAQQLAPEADACFPTAQAPGFEPTPSRLAWCYGDPGVAVALLLAAQRVGDGAWEHASRRVARRAATRPLETSGIVDACLCHGASGLGHVFNRMAQATGDETLAEAARFWLRQTLAMRRPGKGVAGYLTWNTDLNQNQEWAAEHGFLTGAAGIALALLAAVSPLEPAWDRVLMTSLRPLPPRRAESGELQDVA